MSYAVRVLENALRESKAYLEKSKNGPEKTLNSIRGDIEDMEWVLSILRD